MRTRTLHLRGLAYHWRVHLAVGLGVLVGTAALIGALLVGDALRGSLRETALERLGGVDFALATGRYLRAELAEALERETAGEGAALWPAILLRGAVRHAESRRRAADVQVWGVDQRFWRPGATAADSAGASGAAAESSAWPASGRVAVLNQALADALGARPGDDVLLQVARPAAVPTESLLGRRDRTTLTLRLTVHRVIPSRGRGALRLEPRPDTPKNAFLPLATLQAALQQPERINAILASAPEPNRAATLARLEEGLKAGLTLSDLGLRLRTSYEHGYVALECDAFLLDPVVEEAARAAARDVGLRTTGVLAYLANSIALADRPGNAVPYSTVAAVEPPAVSDLPSKGQPPPKGGEAPEAGEASEVGEVLEAGEILLNQWAADDLAARPGDSIQLTYYIPGRHGQLDTQAATFRLRGIVRLEGTAADPGFTPEYPGVTDTENIRDWDPPIPIDLKRIRPRDEDYWGRYRATPKAFINLADGQRLWTSPAERLGRLTSLRLHPRGEETPAATAAAVEVALRARLDPARLGLRWEDVRQRALAASRGTTDFSSLFLGFSLFLILSAGLLVALLFRLGVERRAGEIGLLLALGFTRRRVCGLLLTEGALLAAVAAAAGLLAARGFAWLMLTGPGMWWSAGENVPFLRLHDTVPSYVGGYCVSVLLATGSMAWSLRGLTRRPAQVLLSGLVALPPPAKRRGGALRLAGAGLLAAALALGAATFGHHAVAAGLGISPAAVEASAFFACGLALLGAGLAAWVAWLRGEPRRVISQGGWTGLLRVGVRNARRHAGRSALTVALTAAATFVIVSVQALRAEPSATLARHSGTGGFALMLECTTPLPYDLGHPAGRAASGLSEPALTLLQSAEVMACRLRPGDETSCLNLYRPARPRILGVGEALIARAGFAFAATLAQNDAERANPWLLLRRELPDGAVPAIADEAAALWQLHRSLGEEVVIVDERGQPARLRLVALLRGSVLQGELLVAEEHFTRLFPGSAGYGFFLIDAPAERLAAVAETLERELERYGVAVTLTCERLAALLGIQNMYLATFQTLGGLGLLLGTMGLAAVLLRNVWERRRELALLQAVGFSRAAVGWLVLSENAVLVAAGLLGGAACAAVAGAPYVVEHAHPVTWRPLAALLASVGAVGLASGALAVRAALRAPLVPGLRNE